MISGTGIVTLLVGRDETRVDSCCWRRKGFGSLEEVGRRVENMGVKGENWV